MNRSHCFLVRHIQLFIKLFSKCYFVKKFNKIYYSAIHWALPNLIFIFCISWDLQLKLWWARHSNSYMCEILFSWTISKGFCFYKVFFEQKSPSKCIFFSIWIEKFLFILTNIFLYFSHFFTYLTLWQCWLFMPVPDTVNRK